MYDNEFLSFIESTAPSVISPDGHNEIMKLIT